MEQVYCHSRTISDMRWWSVIWGKEYVRALHVYLKYKAIQEQFVKINLYHTTLHLFALLLLLPETLSVWDISDSQNHHLAWDPVPSITRVVYWSSAASLSKDDTWLPNFQFSMGSMSTMSVLYLPWLELSLKLKAVEDRFSFPWWLAQELWHHFTTDAATAKDRGLQTYWKAILLNLSMLTCLARIHLLTVAAQVQPFSND